MDQEFKEVTKEECENSDLPLLNISTNENLEKKVN